MKPLPVYIACHLEEVITREFYYRYFMPESPLPHPVSL